MDVVQIAEMLRICKTPKPISQARELRSYHITMIQEHLTQSSQAFNGLQRAFSATEFDFTTRPLRKIEKSLSRIKRNTAEQRLKTLGNFQAFNQLLRTIKSINRATKLVHLHQDSYGATFGYFAKFPAEVQRLVWEAAINTPRVIIMERLSVPAGAATGNEGLDNFRVGESSERRKHNYLRQVCWLSRNVACAAQTSVSSDIHKRAPSIFIKVGSDILYFTTSGEADDLSIHGPTNDFYENSRIVDDQFRGRLLNTRIAMHYQELCEESRSSLEEGDEDLRQLHAFWNRMEFTRPSELIFAVGNPACDGSPILFVEPRTSPKFLLSKEEMADTKFFTGMKASQLTWENMAGAAVAMIQETMEERNRLRETMMDAGWTEDELFDNDGTWDYDGWTFHEHITFMEAVSEKEYYGTEEA